MFLRSLWLEPVNFRLKSEGQQGKLADADKPRRCSMTLGIKP
jgi:hypothetical protein